MPLTIPNSLKSLNFNAQLLQIANTVVRQLLSLAISPAHQLFVSKLGAKADEKFLSWRLLFPSPRSYTNRA